MLRCFPLIDGHSLLMVHTVSGVEALLCRRRLLSAAMAYRHMHAVTEARI